MKETALYIHIPFCKHKCIYCDFYSIITTDNIKPFLSALKKEIEFYSEEYSDGRIITSIFFGGGTPSLMETDYLKEILSSISINFKVSDNVETTIETNPGTISFEKLRSFREIGFNRISIGVQSFDENELKFLTRIHSKDAAIETVEDAKKAGFENISVDLIFNLPNQTNEIWMNNLVQAVKLPINHISTYSLILERGTILNKMVLDGKVALHDSDYDADLYSFTIDFLTQKGFYQYEVSNFCKEGFECKHNNAYWHYQDYLSFGTASHSFMNGKRWWNYSSLTKYITEINNKESAVRSFEHLTEEEKLNEYVMLSLRSSGLNKNKFSKFFGNEWLKSKKNYFNRLIENNFIENIGGNLKLTKHGYAICDEILKNLL
ncbi:MAG: coproporphyrinogen III oxidase [Ignavibacteriales bacterium CG12_big_fil_rev_8_21_14_0_65_30_8]|nr:MAG: coproporphyrinogen III oxidase [Ignavibacteriales bacterium CG12_big_fil_rev_8_21_14_0_65_30_8]